MVNGLFFIVFLPKTDLLLAAGVSLRSSSSARCATDHCNQVRLGISCELSFHS